MDLNLFMDNLTYTPIGDCRNHYFQLMGWLIFRMVLGNCCFPNILTCIYCVLHLLYSRSMAWPLSTKVDCGPPPTVFVVPVQWGLLLGSILGEILHGLYVSFVLTLLVKFRFHTFFTLFLLLLQVFFLVFVFCEIPNGRIPVPFPLPVFPLLSILKLVLGLENPKVLKSCFFFSQNSFSVVCKHVHCQFS